MAIGAPLAKTFRRGQSNSQRHNAAFAPAVIPTYTVATLPAASLYSGQMIRVSNGAAGAASIAISDGTNWKVIALGATASAT